jgi:integrase
MSHSFRVPSLRHHRPSGRAVTTIDGRDFYLGPWNSPESKVEYQRLLAEFLSGGLRAGSAEPDLTVNELAARYLEFCDRYYRKCGEPTAEPVNIGLAVRAVRGLYGHTPAVEFGPLRLQTVRQKMIDARLCRNEINKRVRKIVRMFKWATSQELIPSAVVHGLQSLSGLRRDRSDAKESPPVTPVPIAYVEAVLPYTSRQVATMVQLQLLTGARSGEICQMRTCDIDARGKVWCYTPESHKTQHHNRQRKIYLGPQAIEVVRPWLRTELEAYIFAPVEAVAARRLDQRAQRQSRIQPSQRDRRRARPKKRPGQRYTSDSYRRAIEYAIARASKARALRGEPGIPHWHPHMLRHNAATKLRRELGLEYAKAVLGHADTSITEIYAQRDEAMAVQAMLRLG